MRRPDADDERIRRVATMAGCSPKWSEGNFGWAYRCTCRRLDHACDSQCSDITPESALEACQQRGLAPTVKQQADYLLSLYTTPAPRRMRGVS